MKSGELNGTIEVEKQAIKLNLDNPTTSLIKEVDCVDVVLHILLEAEKGRAAKENRMRKIHEMLKECGGGSTI